MRIQLWDLIWNRDEGAPKIAVRRWLYEWLGRTGQP